MLLDLSKTAISGSVREALHDLARAAGVERQRDAMAAGALVNVTVVDGSGQKLLDEAALETARKLKLPPISGTLTRRSFNFIMPVSYRLQ